MNIQQAYEIMSSKIPGSYCIGLDVWNFRRAKPGVEWNLWCSERSKRWTAATLEELVRLVIAEQEFEEAPSLRETDQALSTLSDL
jgi:hypothetical protein